VTLAAGLAALLLFVALVEARLAWRGFVPTTVDTPQLWAEQRLRAGTLGARALILVGGSRLHLAADLPALRQATGLTPVQLAIDGGSFVPVLADLATDPAITGTVIVEVSEHILADRQPADPAREYLRAWQVRREAGSWPTFNDTERWLTRQWRSRLRSYADGASPLNSIRLRLLGAAPVPQYLVTLADRSRYADFSRVPMPDFYLARVMRTLGMRAAAARGMDATAVEAELRARSAALAPALDRTAAFLAAVTRLREQAAAIRGHGGQVYFVKFPAGGLVAEVEERRFPRQRFWDELARGVNAPALHFADVPALWEIRCPDGSHIDMRDRQRFSAAMADALGLAARPGAPAR
jgi:hypothetical protein